MHINPIAFIPTLLLIKFTPPKGTSKYIYILKNREVVNGPNKYIFYF